MSIYSLTLFSQEIIVTPYLQDVTESSVIIMWESSDSGEGKINFGVTPFDLTTEIISTSDIGNGASRIHEANLTSLLPDLKYYYKVTMEDGQSSNLYYFKTLALQVEEPSSQFMAISDMQRDNSKPDKFREIIEEGLIPTILEEVGDNLYDLEGVMIPGDLVVTGGNYGSWNSHFFSQSDSLFPYCPLYPVPGNHEYHSGGLPNFKKYFSLPENGPSSILEECWYKDISNVRIIGLNSNSGSSDQDLQLDWLSETLDSTCADEDIDFVFAQLHHPYKSELWTPGENSFTGKVIDSLEQFTTECNKASLHFFGHTHGYSRGQSQDHKHLWINVATAGGAIDNWGEFPNADYPEFVKSQDEYGFVYVDVEAGLDPNFVIRRYSRGDQDVIQDNIVRDEIRIYNNSIPPKRPIGIFPSDDTLSSSCLLLKSSFFYGIDDTHQASQWQISADSLFDSEIVIDEWRQNENFYNEINTQANDDLTDLEIEEVLDVGNYYWRIRYRNQSLDWSEWSNIDSFYIGSSADTLSSNLILNPDAENDINNWTGDIEALENGECNSVLPFEGNSNFGVGGICQNESDIGIATQTIDLSAFSNEIMNDKLSIAFSGYMRNYNGSDIPEMYVELYADNVLEITSPIISNTTSDWTLKSQIMDLPDNITDVIVVLKGTRIAGTDNDSYFDKLSLYLLDNVDNECSECFGKSNIDADLDGYCNDIDCNDNNDQIYPGAIELCNGVDDNCDMVADIGNTVQWTGNGNNTSWSDPSNWDQNLTPLSCQHVIINANDTVFVDGNFECYTIEMISNTTLIIPDDNSLTVNSQSTNMTSSVELHGNMIIDGLCNVKNSQQAGFEIYGYLRNNNRFNLSSINAETVFVKTGGIFENYGEAKSE